LRSVISELLKSYWYNGKTPHFYFYRNKDQKDIPFSPELDAIPIGYL
jgi:hypothetical protein